MAVTPEACVLYSTLRDSGDLPSRQWAATQASVACQSVRYVDPVCSQLDTLLGSGLAETDRLQTEKFDSLSRICKTQNTNEGVKACSDAMSYYLNTISNREFGSLEAMLQTACRGQQIAGCDSLAFFYSRYTMTGENLLFHGTDQPEKRLSALRMGCQVGKIGLVNCKNLGEMLAERGDYPGAQKSYRTACATAQQSNGAIRDLGSCFMVGLNALHKMDDPITAQAYFEYVCANDSDSNQPYACKHLALMEIDKTDGKTDLQRVLDLLTQACFPYGRFKGDGEGCLYYGRTLLEERNRLRYSLKEGPVINEAQTEPDEDTLRWIAHTASHAFVTGCLSRWSTACEVNDEFITEWISGAYPGDKSTCQIRNREGQITSEKSCQRIGYAVVQPVEDSPGRVVWEAVYVWSDGDKTLVQEDGEQVMLNGKVAFIDASEEGMRCLQNPESGNYFCAPWEEEY